MEYLYARRTLKLISVELLIVLGDNYLIDTTSIKEIEYYKLKLLTFYK